MTHIVSGILLYQISLYQVLTVVPRIHVQICIVTSFPSPGNIAVDDVVIEAVSISSDGSGYSGAPPIKIRFGQPEDCTDEGTSYDEEEEKEKEKEKEKRSTKKKRDREKNGEKEKARESEGMIIKLSSRVGLFEIVLGHHTLCSYDQLNHA